jgi:hypothetical protein
MGEGLQEVFRGSGDVTLAPPVTRGSCRRLAEGGARFLRRSPLVKGALGQEVFWTCLILHSIGTDCNAIDQSTSFIQVTFSLPVDTP